LKVECSIEYVGVAKFIETERSIGQFINFAYRQKKLSMDDSHIILFF